MVKCGSAERGEGVRPGDDRFLSWKEYEELACAECVHGGGGGRTLAAPMSTTTDLEVAVRYSFCLFRRVEQLIAPVQLQDCVRSTSSLALMSLASLGVNMKTHELSVR